MNTLFIVWKKEYETGIGILDEQHRGLVSLINSFFFHRDDRELDINRILVPTAEMFKAYAKINFMTVEKLMADSGYPNLEKYKGIHAEMLYDIEVNDRIYKNNRDIHGFLQYLKEYWIQTAQHHEQEYIEYLLHYCKKKFA